MEITYIFVVQMVSKYEVLWLIKFVGFGFIIYNHLFTFPRFLLDFDIAAPKITVPTDFSPDNKHSTKLMLDLGNLVINTKVSLQNGVLVI